MENRVGSSARRFRSVYQAEQKAAKPFVIHLRDRFENRCGAPCADPLWRKGMMSMSDGMGPVNAFQKIQLQTPNFAHRT
jgi:hypothetical protein